MKLFKILFASVLALTLASCNSHKLEVTSFNFVSFNSRTANISEDVGSISIPVSVFPGKVDKEFRVSVKANASSTAVAEENYTIENDVLTFSPSDEETTKNIVVNIVNKEGIFTGNLSLVLELASVSVDDVVISGSTSYTITIKDNDHPLTALFGDYIVNGVANYQGYYVDEGPFSITAYEGDVTKVTFSNPLVLFASRQDWYPGYLTNSPIYGIVSEDMKTITIPTPQELCVASIFSSDENFMLYRWDSTNSVYIKGDDKIVFEYDEESGVYYTTDAFGVGIPSSTGMMYWDIIFYSDISSDNPTYFYKDED